MAIREITNLLFVQVESGIRVNSSSRVLGDLNKRQVLVFFSVVDPRYGSSFQLLAQCGGVRISY